MDRGWGVSELRSPLSLKEATLSQHPEFVNPQKSQLAVSAPSKRRPPPFPTVARVSDARLATPDVPFTADTNKKWTRTSFNPPRPTPPPLPPTVRSGFELKSCLLLMESSEAKVEEDEPGRTDRRPEDRPFVLPCVLVGLLLKDRYPIPLSGLPAPRGHPVT